MFNPLNPSNYVANREGPSREPDPTANRDLDASPANASADDHDTNSDKVSVNDIHGVEPLHDTSETADRHFSVDSRLEAKLKGAWQRMQQQADQIKDIQREMAKQAQVSQAKLAYLERWYSTELGRMEQKLRGYVDAQIGGVESAYSADNVGAPPLKVGQPQTIQTTYVRPERSDINRGSHMNKVPLFLLLLAVGLTLTHLLATVMLTYTGSSSTLAFLSEITVRQLLPAIIAIIGISGAIAFTWELRK